MRLLVRLLRVWGASALLAGGAALIYGATRAISPVGASLLFFVGAFLIVASVPVWPWLVVQPTRFAVRYWAARD